MNRPHDGIALVLQGGGALGAYQAGAYAALSETVFQPDWIVGVSIGAINAALIAGNLPEHRVEHLREFWYRVSSGTPLVRDALSITPWIAGPRSTYPNPVAAYVGLIENVTSRFGG